MVLLIAFSFIAGIVTILSPCILPILPIILSSSIGGKNTGKGRPLGVVAGFVASFTFFTLFLSTIVRLFAVPADSLRLISVIVIGLFGISLVIPAIQIKMELLFSKLAGFVPLQKNREGFGGGLIIGLSIGLLWTPCVGPILASVISLAIVGTVTFDSFLITLSYSLGTAIPMFLIIWGGQSVLKTVPWLVRNLGNIQKIFGIVMILTALAIFFNFDRRFQTFILTTFPQYGTGLTKLEDNATIRRELDKRQNSNQEQIEIPQKDMGRPSFEVLKPKGQKAPEIITGGIWFNLPALRIGGPADRQGSEPLTLEQLKGKVVIVDFWTYTCINCQRTIPYLRTWYEKYKDKGLVVIGVHSPEFEFEKNQKNVAQAIADFKITYPVVQDNLFATWQAYSNRYWPAKYIIDKDGYIRYTHFGEGEYDETEMVIQELLKESGAQGIPSTINNPTYDISSKTPETYLGYGRIENFVSPYGAQPEFISTYSLPDEPLQKNQFAYEGRWLVMEQYANPQAGGKLHFNFDAKEVYLVMRPKGQPATVKIFLDDQVQAAGEDVVNGTVTVDKDRLYKLIKLPQAGQHMLRLEFDDSNVEVYAFTFG